MENTKEEAKKFVENGGKCIYRYGWAWKGAGASPLSKEDALDKLSKSGWKFGKGFYELSWITMNNETVLEFNELSDNDMW